MIAINIKTICKNIKNNIKTKRKNNTKRIINIL